MFYRSLYWVVAIACAVIAALMGSISGGEAGAAMGVFNGLAVGYAYVHLALRVKTGNIAQKMLTRTVYGALAGLVSGGLAHVPGLFVNNREASGLLGLGAVAGLIIGTVFGLILACLFALLPPPEEAANTGGGGSK